MSSVPLPARTRAGTPRRTLSRSQVAASTRFAAPDTSGPGADRLRDNLRLLGGEPTGPTSRPDGRRPR